MAASSWDNCLYRFTSISLAGIALRVHARCHLACDSKDAAGRASTCSAVAGELTKAAYSIPSAYSTDASWKEWKSSIEKAGEAAPAPSGAKAPDDTGDASLAKGAAELLE